MATLRYTGDELWDRIERAVEKVKNRLNRVAAALNQAGVPYAVVGGNAVQIWVAQVDESAVRNTRDVDILLNRSDLERAKAALEKIGFVYRRAASLGGGGIDMFLDGPQAKARDAVHVVFAGERVKGDSLEPSPGLSDFVVEDSLCTLPLEELVRMKLTSYRRKDQVHLLDMINVGLLDETWPERYSSALGGRLQALLDDPEG
ncbi:MAG: nucleotidyltransferase family protein [Planctomycetota bacterium]